MDFTKLTIKEIVKAIKNQEFTATEITKFFLKQIEDKDYDIKAFLNVTREEALTKAKKVDDKIANGEEVGRLAGVPYTLKDNYLTEGIETTSASRILEGYVPQYSATMYSRLEAEDAILVGKVNLDTFAFGSSTENSGYHTTKNPHDLERVPGGSSGGSAASVAADMCVFSLGSDTGGSIRLPASFCGVVGLKPTYGRNSRYGLTAMGSSFDCPGPIAKTVEDAAVVMEVLAGEDPEDATTSDLPVPDYSELLNSDVKGLKIGLPKEYFVDGVEQEVKDSIMNVAKQLEEMGAEIKEISLPHTDYGLAVYYILVPSEISSNMGRYDGIRFGPTIDEEVADINEYFKKTRAKYLEPEVKRRIMIGSYTLSAGSYDAYYLKAAKVRTLIRQDFEKAFDEVDFILAPTSPTTAFKIGENTSEPLKMYLADVFTITINVAGIPSISIPSGKDSNGLPIGAQIMGRDFDEAKLMGIASSIEAKLNESES